MQLRQRAVLVALLYVRLAQSWTPPPALRMSSRAIAVQCSLLPPPPPPPPPHGVRDGGEGEEEEDAPGL
eukprot:1561089-Prymnesium_polylepis.1